MRFPDPYLVKLAQPKDIVVFAASQLPGDRENQEDYFINFNDECFAVADGVGGIPNGEIAAKLACETTIWAYKHVRQRPTYWRDKRLFMRRIFRSTNITLWQKQREPEFKDGMATTLLVLMTGSRTFWLGSVGDSSAFLLRNQELTKLTREDRDDFGGLTKVLGGERYGIKPQFVTDRFGLGDAIFLTTDGVADWVRPEEIKQILNTCGTTTHSLTESVVALLKLAETNGATDNMTAVIVKRVATSEKSDTKML